MARAAASYQSNRSKVIPHSTDYLLSIVADHSRRHRIRRSSRLSTAGAPQHGIFGGSMHASNFPVTSRFGRALGPFLLIVACAAYPIPSSASHVAAGLMFSCADSGFGSVYCWGANYSGQLGDGTTTARDKPVAVMNLHGARDIAAGVDHACAITNAGGVRCWGSNGLGQLGDGTFTDRLTPVDVAGLTSGVTAIAVGSQYSCALLDSGQVRCWGDNFFDELGHGDPSLVSSPVPVDVKLAAGVTAVAIAATGGNLGDDPPHSCIVTTTGGVQCWGGLNFYGELGIPYGQVAPTPTEVTNLSSGVKAIAVTGDHSCALTQMSEILCWGDNSSGELGDGTTSVGHYEPVPTLPLNEVPISIAVSGGFASIGQPYTCAMTSSGSTYCWGANWHGTQGTGDTDDSLVPRLTQIPKAVELTLSDEHACGRLPSGVACWGDNLYGQIGNGTISFRTTPQQVQGLGGAATNVFAGAAQSCAIVGGSARCWGYNQSGELGDGTRTDRLFPVSVTGLPSDIMTMSLAVGHTCAVSGSGSVYCWGRGGTLGDGTEHDSETPVQVAGAGLAIAVDAGTTHTCAISVAGAVVCWGSDVLGELGDDNASGEHSLVPVPAIGLTAGVIGIAAGESHSCALLNSGDVRCWGYNGSGQLGDGTFDQHNHPVDVDMSALGQGTIAIAAGAQFSCALNANGSIKCWGLSYTPVPALIAGLGGPAVSLTAGDNHACATFMDGTIQCWGMNGFGQLGDGTLISSVLPVDVTGMPVASSLDAGNAHTCALASSGDVYCWGQAVAGQLGNGDYGSWPSPQAVLGTFSDRIFSDDFDPGVP
jgi:alpha-tubulin suppressor-like RCC1 family protein